MLSSDSEFITYIHSENEGSAKSGYGSNGVIIEIYDPGESESDFEVVPGSADILVNINTATAEELDEILPGIGPVKAQAIVEYRTLVGGFGSVWELIEVEGIGEKTLEQILPHCTV